MKYRTRIYYTEAQKTLICFTGKKQGISWIRPRIGGIEAS